MEPQDSGSPVAGDARALVDPGTGVDDVWRPYDARTPGTPGRLRTPSWWPDREPSEELSEAPSENTPRSAPPDPDAANAPALAFDPEPQGRPTPHRGGIDADPFDDTVLGESGLGGGAFGDGVLGDGRRHRSDEEDGETPSHAHGEPGSDDEAFSPGEPGTPGVSPEVPAFAWSIDDAEEVSARPASSRWWLWGSVIVTLIVVGVVGALAFLGTARKRTAAPVPAVPVEPARSPAAASPLGPRESYMPHNLVVGTAEGRYQVTWATPERADDVVGYLVVVQSPQGAVRTQQLLGPGKASAVFAMADIPRDSCFVVGALVRNGAEPLAPIGSEPLCL